MVTTTYTCTGLGPGAESVVNGNFEQGNVGFTSAYQYNTNLWGEGTYYVDYDASLHHENFVGLGHGGTGNFMIVNGATSPGTNVWTETISVQPNQTYAFSTWVCTLAGQSNEVAWLQFSINGNQIGEVFQAPPYTNTWQQFYQLWNSGNSTTATITILNQNTGGSGNDFGLDDISFCQLVVLGEPQCTVVVNSMTASATADDTELCEGESTTLHALPTGGSGNYSFIWTPAGSLSNANVQHPVATPPLGTTTYTCQVTDNSWGSSQSVSVTVVVYPNEQEHEYETICEGDTYDFYGQMVSAPNTYEHHIQTQYGCDKTIYLHLDNWPMNDTLVVDASICQGQVYDFHGTLYDQDGQEAYFDTLDSHGCLKVEKLELTVGEYQMPPVQYQYECYARGTVPSWTWDKTGVTYHEDTYDEIVLPDPEGGCDIKHRLDLRFHEEFYHEETKVACDAYYWPVNGVTYSSSQDRVEAVFHHEFGETYCDSTYVLHLEISNYETSDYTLGDDENCDSYLWDPQGHAYTTGDGYDPEDHVYTESGEYHRTYTNVQGCDSIVTMTMLFDYTPHPSAITPLDPANTAPHWVITATEFQINVYDFHVWDINPECRWDTVTWGFVEPVTWVLEPFGEKGKCCKMYVLNQVEDTVWLEARAYNRCAPEEGVSRRYWFVCSFYGMEEQKEAAKVYPNPTCGVVTIEADNIEQVRVVDMLGQVVEDKRYNRSDSVTLEMMHLPSSIYLFEIRTKDGIHKQRVVLNK